MSDEGVFTVTDEATPRTYERLTRQHLNRLSDLAELDRRKFDEAQPAFEGHHIATVLAQGAVLHWINGANGVKDLDVWSFFALPPGFTRFPADVRTRHVDFGPSSLGRQTYDLDDPHLSATDKARFTKWSKFTGRRVDLMLAASHASLTLTPSMRSAPGSAPAASPVMGPRGTWPRSCRGDRSTRTAR